MENTYHFTNEQAGMPVKLGKLARYFGKLLRKQSELV